MNIINHSFLEMNSYFTRSQQQILESTPNYNTRLQSRIRSIINDNLNESNQTMRANIRNEIQNGIQFAGDSIDNNQLNQSSNINIDFDEASRAWNANKRRVGQSYEYVNGMTTRSRSRTQND